MFCLSWRPLPLYLLIFISPALNFCLSIAEICQDVLPSSWYYLFIYFCSFFFNIRSIMIMIMLMVINSFCVRVDWQKLFPDLFPDQTIVRDSHHLKSPACLSRIGFCAIRLCWIELCIVDNHYTTTTQIHHNSM